MGDLDKMVQENQLNTLPIAKSGRAEDELLERHPELLDLLDKSRRRKIDSMALQSRLHEDERRAEKISKSLGKSPILGAKSPILMARKSSADLVFDMEDDSGQTSGSHKDMEGPSTESRSSRIQEAKPWQLQTPPLGEAGAMSYFYDEGLHGTSSPSSGPVPALHLPSASTTLENHKSPEDISPSVTKSETETAAAWGNASLNTNKLDMKQIMAQASEIRQSNISRAMSGVGSSSNSKPTPTAKLSQREKKRQLQQQRQQTAAIQPVAPVSPALTASPTPPQPKQSPWQIAQMGPKVSLTEMLNAPKEASMSPLENKSRPSPTLTMRQTVPGNIQRKPSFQSTNASTLQTPQPQRSISQPNTTSPTSTAQTPKTPSRPPLPISQSSTSAVTTPRSIKHSPTPVEPTIQLSMADILAQQQTEKEVLKEAVAKRSLLEIQEEQAFQEWWDQEEKATRERMEAEEAAKSKSDRGERDRGRGGRGKGKSRGGGTGTVERGKGKAEGEGRGESATTKGDEHARAPISKGRGPTQGSGNTSSKGEGAKGARRGAGAVSTATESR